MYESLRLRSVQPHDHTYLHCRLPGQEQLTEHPEQVWFHNKIFYPTDVSSTNLPSHLVTKAYFPKVC